MRNKFSIIISSKTKKGEEELNKVLEQKGFIVSAIATKTKLAGDPPKMLLTFKSKTAKVWSMVLSMQKSEKEKLKIIENNILKNMFDLPLNKNYIWVYKNG